jgi:phosphoribosylpyrophosphate synthetase
LLGASLLRILHLGVPSGLLKFDLDNQFSAEARHLFNPPPCHSRPYTTFNYSPEAPLAVVAKDRPRVDIAIPLQILGDVRGRICLIVDDMASTGRTVVGAAEMLLQAGAKEVHALFIHAVMAPGALERICAASVQRIVTTDSVRSAPDPRLQVVSIAPFLARTLDRLAGEA